MFVTTACIVLRSRCLMQGYKDLFLCFLLWAMYLCIFSSYVSTSNLFGLSYVYDVRSNPTLLHVEYPIVPIPFVEKNYYFPIELSWRLCQNPLTITVRVSLWSLDSVSFIYMAILMPVPHYTGSCNFVGSIEINFDFPLKIAWLLRILCISIRILESIVSIYTKKKSWGGFERYCFESVWQFGECYHLNNIKFPDP